VVGVWGAQWRGAVPDELTQPLVLLTAPACVRLLPPGGSPLTPAPLFAECLKCRRTGLTASVITGLPAPLLHA
jgi:hypothetical protein